MFGFGKQNNLVPLESDESKDEPQRTDAGSTEIASGYAATQSAQLSKQQAAVKFKKPDKYTGNRSLFDSGAAKRQAKLDAFKDGAVVIDPYTEKRLVPTKKEAKLRYKKNWQKHLAESDHAVPLEQGYNMAKDNPWLTVDDIKMVLNAPDNINVISREVNNAKRSGMNNEDLVKHLEAKGIVFSEQGKQALIRDGTKALDSIVRQYRQRSLTNAVTTGHVAGMQGAQASGETALTMSGIMNLVAVIKEEKTGEEAVTDTIKDAGKAAVTGYAMGGGLTVVSQTLSSSKTKFITDLAKSNIPGKVITVVMTIGDTLKRYANGEITTQECMIELGERGLNTITTGYAMAAGQALIPIPILGAAIGALVGSALTSSYYHNLINALQAKELEHKERMRIIAECNKAAEQARAFRAELESYLESYFKDYRDCFDEALSVMQFSFQVEDADGMITGANLITRKLGGPVYYESVDEFKDFLDSGTTDIF